MHIHFLTQTLSTYLWNVWHVMYKFYTRLVKCTCKKDAVEIKIANSWLWTFCNVKGTITFKYKYCLSLLLSPKYVLVYRPSKQQTGWTKNS